MPFMGIPFGVCEAGGQVLTVDPGIDIQASTQQDSPEVTWLESRRSSEILNIYQA